MGEPGGLLSVGSHRVGPDWSGLAAAAATKWFYNIVSDSVTWYNFLNPFGNLFLSRAFDLFNSTFKLPPKETLQRFEKKFFLMIIELTITSAK